MIATDSAAQSEVEDMQLGISTYSIKSGSLEAVSMDSITEVRGSIIAHCSCDSYNADKKSSRSEDPDDGDRSGYTIAQRLLGIRMYLQWSLVKDRRNRRKFNPTLKRAVRSSPISSYGDAGLAIYREAKSCVRGWAWDIVVPNVGPMFLVQEDAE
ncbi:hypothetical protein BJ508DRAFT_309735 [Ascobolus immersus RN42]|uniref:Uncharacterized protein n=1 Tax=Ascobolus immersus RN42 TaxID=1160509 RepID=A0A3N4I1A8_ASCIM|nr:hypothetical protein BJ508DRAFT_309735 [Ascobolus immersus RN42]